MDASPFRMITASVQRAFGPPRNLVTTQMEITAGLNQQPQWLARTTESTGGDRV